MSRIKVVFQDLEHRDTIRLDLIWFTDHQRSTLQHPDPNLTVSGNYAMICLPFWRALRHLQGRCSTTEFEQRWRAPFPTQKLARLTTFLEKQA